jgi:vanillate O-demethylase ferredoxin subunit
MPNPTCTVIVRQLRLECEGVVSVELCRPDGAALPFHAPGAHLDVNVPGAGVRSYSLLDAPAGPCAEYRIAVQREPDGRGGSRWFHEVARVGHALEIAAPADDFTLVEDAASTVFIAGGIGITPLLSMIRRLVALGRPWELHQAASTRRRMPFAELLDDLAAKGRGLIVRHCSELGGGRMSVEAIVRDAPPGTHLYCCGPSGMVDDFLAAGASRPPGTVHHERFAARQAAATDGGFTLKLARDGRCLPVPAGKSILDVLLDAGLDVPYSCTQGVCGTCRITVLEGEPEHRDDFLTDEERASNQSVIACCSGARTAHLTLDL